MRRKNSAIPSFASALLVLPLLGTSVLSCGPTPTVVPDNTAATETPPSAEASGDQNNALLAAWAGPYGGVPAFDQMQLKDLEKAMTLAMNENLAEIDAIADNQEPPTFENTIVAQERSGARLNRVFSFWGIWSSNLSTPEFREIQGRMAPILSEFSSQITQNERLFSRVKAVHDSPELKSLSPAQQRLVQLTYDSFARNGATLNPAAKKRYAAINQRLAELHTKFSNNVLADEEGYVLYLSESQLGGLPASVKAAAAKAATDRDHAGEFAIANTRSSMDPFLTYSNERGLREQVWRSYYSRGGNGDKFDNNAIIAEILRLRHERITLLGYKNYAEWRLENRMAKTPERALELLEAVWPAAIARAHEEVQEMQALADKELAADKTSKKIKIEPWDYRYYADKVRKDKYDLDSNEVKEYLQLDKLREAMFMVAGELFGFSFTPVPEGSVPVFHEDVKVWEVTNKSNGTHIGLWYLDPYARPGKRSGAWATSYRGHATFDGAKTVLSSNNSNFSKAAPGQAVLISWDDATTYFHEFGHALHALSSKVTYPTLNNGVRDYTEFHSQLLERWLLTDKVIQGYLVHYKTGAPMPADLIAKIKKASTFNQGFSTTEYLASAIMDMRYHMTDPTGIDPATFERETLSKLKMPKQIVMRHRSTQFSHIFSGEGYSAGYYGYMWSDVLTADAAESFAEAPGGFYDPQQATKLVQFLFSPRNAVDPADAYRDFRGRDAEIEALMRDRGFSSKSKSKK